MPSTKTIDLYAEASVQPVTFAALRELADAGTLTSPRIISPLINGRMNGMFTVGSATGGSNARVEIDGTNQRIIINDGTNDRVLIGYQAGGF